MTPVACPVFGDCGELLRWQASMDAMPMTGPNGENEAAERWAKEATRLRELLGDLLGVVTRIGGYMEAKDQAILFRAQRAVAEWTK